MMLDMLGISKVQAAFNDCNWGGVAYHGFNAADTATGGLFGVMAGDGIGSAVGKLGGTASKVVQVEEVAENTVGDFTYAKSAAAHLTEYITKGESSGMLARPYMQSPLTINSIIATGEGVPDVIKPGATKYVVPGSLRGSEGMYELVVDHSTNTIYHFLFRR